MNDISKLLNEIIESDNEIKIELERLDLKYKIIDELINYRNTLNISQSEFATRIGVKQQMISRFEKGEVDPRISFVAKILLGMRKEVVIKDKDYVNVSNEMIIIRRKKITKLPANYKLVG